MNIRRALSLLLLAVICALATPTPQSEAKATPCFYPFVRVKQHWYKNSCGPGAPAGSICSDVITLVGEEGVDCDGNDISWGYVTNYMVTYRRIQCTPICE